MKACSTSVFMVCMENICLQIIIMRTPGGAKISFLL